MVIKMKSKGFIKKCELTVTLCIQNLICSLTRLRKGNKTQITIVKSNRCNFLHINFLLIPVENAMLYIPANRKQKGQFCSTHLPIIFIGNHIMFHMKLIRLIRFFHKPIG